MSESEKAAYWPPGPTRVDVEECLLAHSRVLMNVYCEQYEKATPEVRFLLSALGQLVVQHETAVRMFHDYPGALEAQRRVFRD